MLVIVGVGKRLGRNFDKFSTTQAQHVLLFLALRFRDNDHGPVTASTGYQRQSDTGVSGCAFDNHTTGLEITAGFGFKNHLPGRAVLDGLTGVHELGLAENFATRFLGQSFQTDEGRVTDRIDNRSGHRHLFFPG